MRVVGRRAGWRGRSADRLPAGTGQKPFPGGIRDSGAGS
jgi:hypothetical protein